MGHPELFAECAEAVELSVSVHFGLDSLDVLAVTGALGSALIKGIHCLLLLVVVWCLRSNFPEVGVKTVVCYRDILSVPLIPAPGFIARQKCDGNAFRIESEEDPNIAAAGPKLFHVGMARLVDGIHKWPAAARAHFLQELESGKHGVVIVVGKLIEPLFYMSRIDYLAVSVSVKSDIRGDVSRYVNAKVGPRYGGPTAERSFG